MSLKILHISTSDTGGAGLAALRLHQTFLHQLTRVQVAHVHNHKMHC